MQSEDPAGIEFIRESILHRLDSANSSRDRALNEGRHIIRMSANAIRAIHRNDLRAAEELIAKASELLLALIDHLDGPGGIRWAGYVQDAMKEYAEARHHDGFRYWNETPGTCCYECR